MDTDNRQGAGKAKKIVIVAIAALMLVFFPLMALQMSRSGLQAYRQMKAEMRFLSDSIKIPDLPLYNQEGENVTIAALKEKVVVVHFFDKNCQNCEPIWKEMKRVQSEFKEKARKRVQLLSISLDSDSSATLKELIAQQQVDTLTWQLLGANPESITQLLREGYKLDKEKAPYTLALINVNGNLVNHYDARNAEEVNQMMMHMAMLIPAKKDRKHIKHRQEKELYK